MNGMELDAIIRDAKSNVLRKASMGSVPVKPDIPMVLSERITSDDYARYDEILTITGEFIKEVLTAFQEKNC